MIGSPEEALHVLGLMVGVGMGVPGIIANARNRAHLMPLTDKEATPLEELPVLTATAMAVGAFIRVPNQVSGLLRALYGEAHVDYQKAKRFGIMSFSSFFVGLVFFVTLWLMAERLPDPEAAPQDRPALESKQEAALISAAASTGVLAITAMYFLRGWALKQAIPSPGSGWQKGLDVLQLCSLPLAAVAFVPQFMDIHRKGGLVTDALSVWTTALYVLDSLLRVPNVGRGLFHALRENDTGDRNKMILSLAGILIIIGVFYATLVCQAVYNTDASEDTRRSKKTATILSAVYGACILLVVAYLAKGLRDPTFR